MSHLNLETLARIVDESASVEEARHLEQCTECTAELAALREDVHALSLLPDMTPAPETWGALERRLLNEGLIQPRARTTFAFTPFAFTPFLQLAAAVVLVLGGVLAGRLTTPLRAPLATQAAAPAVDRNSPASFPSLDPMNNVNASQATSSNVTLASSNISRAATPRTLEEAAALLRQTEELYVGALTRYAELSTDAPAGDLVARFAALQSIVMTTQAALTQAPADPVINGYHLTALAQRDVVLRQVAAASGERWY